MKDARGLIPKGWKTPTDEDWKVLDAQIRKRMAKITMGKSNDTNFSATLSGNYQCFGSIHGAIVCLLDE